MYGAKVGSKKPSIIRDTRTQNPGKKWKKNCVIEEDCEMWLSVLMYKYNKCVKLMYYSLRHSHFDIPTIKTVQNGKHHYNYFGPGDFIWHSEDHYWNICSRFYIFKIGLLQFFTQRLTEQPNKKVTARPECRRSSHHGFQENTNTLHLFWIIFTGFQ